MFNLELKKYKLTQFIIKNYFHIDDKLKDVEKRFTKNLKQNNKRFEEDEKEIKQIKNEVSKLKEHVKMHDKKFDNLEKKNQSMRRQY